jgi:S-adenosylmethionine:tRNA ribosyltransferase-isomerase
MSPAIAPPLRRDAVRLLVLDGAAGTLRDHAFAELPQLLGDGDLLVLNDAATLPASLVGQGPGGDPLEVRLVAPSEHGDPTTARWLCVLFGAGDWHTRTEDRPPPPSLAVGDTIVLGQLSARVVALDPRSDRLVQIEFDRDGEALVHAIYREGRPVQYSHLQVDLDLWDVQTVYAARPWAVEMPSAGRPITLGMLEALRVRGVRVATLTHAAGLSATGDDALDAALPLPERYEIPPATIDAIATTRAVGGRVIAVGTTVVRALESSALANGGRPRAGAGEATLVLGPGFRPSVVDGILSGIHEPTESHYRLLAAFAPIDDLARASAFATLRGYRTHEFGDSCLVLGRSRTYAAQRIAREEGARYPERR